jgi:hypothetical protein
MQGKWYCSDSCFASAAEKEISMLLPQESVQPDRASRMPLGLILVGRGFLTGEQLRAASDEQKESGGEIGEILVRLGFVTETQVASMRAIQWGCPVFALANQTIPSGIPIPMPLMRRYSMIPLHFTPARNLLLVGFVHCVEYGLLYAIERMTGHKTEPCFVTPADFQLGMDERKRMLRPPSSFVSGGLEFENSRTAGEMAQALCKSAVEGELEEALIARCKDYLWARLKCDSKVIDLLFNAV